MEPLDVRRFFSVSEEQSNESDFLRRDGEDVGDLLKTSSLPTVALQFIGNAGGMTSGISVGDVVFKSAMLMKMVFIFVN